MDTFLLIIMAYVLPIIIVKFLNKLSIKLFDEDLTNWVNVIEFYIPAYNILVVFAIIVVFIGILCCEIYDECKYRFGKAVDIGSIKDKLRKFLR